MDDPIRAMMRARMGGAGSTGDQIAQTLAAQRDLYVQLEALARQQSQYVATGEAEALVQVLSARSTLIEKVAPLDAKLQPYKGRWQEVLDGLPEGERVKVATLLKEVQQLLADILARDEADKESLIRQKQQIGAEIGKTVSGVALNRAYGVKPRTMGSFGKA